MVLVLTGRMPTVLATPDARLEPSTCCGGDCRCGDSCPCVAKSVPAPPPPNAAPTVALPTPDRLTATPPPSGVAAEGEQTRFEPTRRCGTRPTRAADGRSTLLRKHVLRT